MHDERRDLVELHTIEPTRPPADVRRRSSRTLRLRIRRTGASSPGRIRGDRRGPPGRSASSHRRDRRSGCPPTDPRAVAPEATRRRTARASRPDAPDGRSCPPGAPIARGRSARAARNDSRRRNPTTSRSARSAGPDSRWSVDRPDRSTELPNRGAAPAAARRPLRQLPRSSPCRSIRARGTPARHLPRSHRTPRRHGAPGPHRSIAAIPVPTPRCRRSRRAATRGSWRTARPPTPTRPGTRRPCRRRAPRSSPRRCHSSRSPPLGRGACASAHSSGAGEWGRLVATDDLAEAAGERQRGPVVEVRRHHLDADR